MSASAEVAFWAHWIATRGAGWRNNYARRMAPTQLLPPQVEAEVARVPAGRAVRILEVGCGPVTGMGNTSKAGRELEIVYSDPLAEEYAKLWRATGIPQPHAIVQSPAENILDTFPADAFDIAYASNCIDHGSNPPQAVLACCQVVRPGGAVILTHKINEGRVERYSGLHQWNLYPHGGAMWCSARGGDAVNVSELVEHLADTESIQAARAWFTTVLRRR